MSQSSIPDDLSSRSSPIPMASWSFSADRSGPISAIIIMTRYETRSLSASPYTSASSGMIKILTSTIQRLLLA
jgi:hypothetical protein